MPQRQTAVVFVAMDDHLIICDGCSTVSPYHCSLETSRWSDVEEYNLTHAHFCESCWKGRGKPRAVNWVKEGF